MAALCFHPGLCSRAPASAATIINQTSYAMSVEASQGLGPPRKSFCGTYICTHPECVSIASQKQLGKSRRKIFEARKQFNQGRGYTVRGMVDSEQRTGGVICLQCGHIHCEACMDDVAERVAANTPTGCSTSGDCHVWDIYSEVTDHLDCLKAFVTDGSPTIPSSFLLTKLPPLHSAGPSLLVHQNLLQGGVRSGKSSATTRQIYKQHRPLHHPPLCTPKDH